MMERDETMDTTDAGRIYEIIKGDSCCDILDDEEVNYPETKDFGASWADQSNLQSYLHTL